MKRPRRAHRRRRIQRVLVRALRRSFPHLGRFTPSLSSRLAEALFRTPPKQARLCREERTLADARFSRTPNGDGSIPTWKWGEGRPVVLVHGWGGHGGRLTEFVAPLVRRGFSVIRGRPRVAQCRTREDARSRTSPDPVRPAGDFARRGVRRERSRSPGGGRSSGIRFHSAGAVPPEAVARSVRLLKIR